MLLILTNKLTNKTKLFLLLTEYPLQQLLIFVNLFFLLFLIFK